MRRALCLLAFAAAAAGEEDAERRVASASGAHAATLRRDGRFRLHHEGRLLASGTLPHARRYRVLDRGPTIVAFGGERLVTVVGKDGAVLWTRESDASRPPAMWVDEERGEIVVAFGLDDVQVHDLTTGKKRAGGRATVLRAFDLYDPRPAFALLHDAPSVQVVEAARRLLATTKDGGLRLAVADFLGRATADHVRTALDGAHPATDFDVALRHLELLPAEERVEWLARAARKGEVAARAVRELGKRPETGPLLDLVLDGDLHPSARPVLRATLLAKGPLALSPLLAQIEGADRATKEWIVDAAIGFRAKDLVVRMQPYQHELVDLLKSENRRVLECLGGFFTQQPTTEAVQPLLAALGRHARDTRLRAVFLQALRSCTGLDYGDDPAAWFKNLRR